MDSKDARPLKRDIEVIRYFSRQLGALSEGRVLDLLERFEGKPFKNAEIREVFEWWENVVQSASQAREQVRASLKKHLGPKPALGAYILIIDWKITKLGRIYVERVS